MKILFTRYFVLYTLFTLGVILIGAFFYMKSHESNKEIRPTERVSHANISVFVKASGKMDALNIAKLGFPVSGTIQHIFFREGDVVKEGDIIASLTQDSIIASYESAKETLAYYEYTKDDIAAGTQDVDKQIAKTNVAIADAELARVTKEYDAIVKNARARLLSEGLTAIPEKSTNDDIPPIISGNYICDTEGGYTLKVFSSQSASGYSYVLTGLESGTYTAYTAVATPLGMCGLTIQFDDNDRYRNTTWTISLPNTRSPEYLNLKNAYDLAVTERTNAIERATQALTLAQNTESSVIAPARQGLLGGAQANIAAARADVARFEAEIRDYTIRAPFAGTITENTLRVGEVVHPARSISLMENGRYEFKARIPEVDVAKIQLGNQADVTFDALPETPLRGTIAYISPYAEQVEGVAYYDTKITFETAPDWLRAGLNADVRIITKEKQQALTLPERFIERKNGKNFVYRENETTPTQITTGLVGTNGLVEIIDLPLGTQVTAP
ncbi:efflux RND transporter periplasmic adaptor subunit [Candidatus Kaiserbacteria bacterium]|nr:MAG: efflux RND transporter periplasmic adaptor subunit [Candidatus Kaiserbacteria bacterium]